MSDEVKHTPGPWGYDLNHTIATFDDCGEWGESIVQLPYGTRGRSPTAKEQANAMLAAAAPELLAACELALKACQENIAMWAYKNEPPLLEAINALRPAIAKATASQP